LSAQVYFVSLGGDKKRVEKEKEELGEIWDQMLTRAYQMWAVWHGS
jgi:hypothetical protein